MQCCNDSVVDFIMFRMASLSFMIYFFVLFIFTSEGEEFSSAIVDTELLTVTITGPAGEAGHLSGLLYLTASDGSMYRVSLVPPTDEASIIKYELKLHGANETSHPFIPIAEGSGGGQLSPDKTICHRLVHDVFHNYAYIAVEKNIIIIHLNISMDTTVNNPYLKYEVLHVGHTPDQVQAFKYVDDTMLLVHYTTIDGNGYVKRYRQYEDRVWEDYGSPVLVTSPSWYDVNTISNTLLYRARDVYYDYDTLWVAVASQWYIHACSLINGIYRTYTAPEPCDSITRLVYGQHSQHMLIECKEATVLFNAKDKLFSAIWDDVIGTVYISNSGKYGAIVSSNKSSITIIHLKHTNNEGYKMFRLESVHGQVANATFVDVNSTKHFLCYFELKDDYYSIHCIDVELGFQYYNMSDHAKVTFELPNSLTEAARACTELYTHHNLLLFQRNICYDDNCIPVLQVYDMATLTNAYNITGIDPTFLAYKILSVEQPTEAVLINNNTVDTNTSEAVTSVTVTTSQSSTETTNTPTPPLTKATPTTPLSQTTPTLPQLETTHTPTDLLLAQCTIELADTKSSYDNLQWITVLVCTLFCVALIITILLLVVMLCIACRSNRVTVKVEPGCQGSYSSPPKYLDE